MNDVPEEVFQVVQDRLNGKSRPHKQLSEDFPLRGFVKCIQCGKNVTAGWAKGQKERYPHYWCWTKGCGAVKAGRDDMERHWLTLLSKMLPTEELLEQLPTIAARQLPKPYFTPPLSRSYGGGHGLGRSNLQQSADRSCGYDARCPSG